MIDNQTILVLDDESGFRNEIKEFLETEGHTVYAAGRPAEALEMISAYPIDIAIFDIRLPGKNGLALLKEVSIMNLGIDIIMMTGYGTMDTVVEALRNGATDFLNKPFKFTELRDIIHKSARYRKVRKELNGRVTEYDRMMQDHLSLIGEAPPMHKLKEIIYRVANAGDTTVLVTGESGTGKELVARSIHLLSERKDNSFIPVNCSSIPEELFENEFFGHVKGSYTDAKHDQQGLFEAADKGTLFLDEIGDLKFSMQAKLLRVIEEKKISRIGHHGEKEVDVRIIAATNQDVEKMVAERTFRQDLYHRLNLFRIDLPPLRDRRDDIPLLFDHFVETMKGKFRKPIHRVERSIIHKLVEYDFPGNVRELKHMVERAMILSDGNTLREKDFVNLSFIPAKQAKARDMAFDTLDLNVIEKESIVRALKEAGNNKSRAARMLNISRQALDRKVERYGIRVRK